MGEGHDLRARRWGPTGAGAGAVMRRTFVRLIVGGDGRKIFEPPNTPNWTTANVDPNMSNPEAVKIKKLDGKKK